ncbi:MAG TPA: cyclic nucleotide-binding domain-containing protein, partial [Paracoccaceae bacterium]
MDTTQELIIAFLETVHPYDSLPRDELARVASCFSRREFSAGEEVYHAGEPLKGLYLVKRGSIEVLEPSGGLVSLLGPRNSFGERGLLRDGVAVTTARVTENAVLLLLPTHDFRRLIADFPAFERFFNRGRASAESRGADLTTQK